MLPITLTDEQWQKILPVLRSHPNAYVGQEDECRRFLSAVLWMARAGAQWRLLPKEYGYWNSAYRRFARWAEQGVFEQMHQALADEPDMQHLLIDSTIVRAHACAAGAPKKSVAGRRVRR
jgi:transposase